MFDYRPYQAKLDADIEDAWLSHRNVLAQLATGGGKTVIFSGILARSEAPSVAIAHRQELVGQMSVALTRNEVPHRIIAPPPTIRQIIQLQIAETGNSYYSPQAPCAVAGVDTLIRRGGSLGSWCKSVQRWVIDEGHHVLRRNKWGRAVEMFPAAKGLLVTATPERADGLGLGSHADGVADVLVEGPPMRALIEDGYLTDYRVFAPTTAIDLSRIKLASDGDYNRAGLADAVHKSQIIGDVVTNYWGICPGKTAVVFVPDVQTATDMAARFVASGVSASSVSADTPILERMRTMQEFRAGRIKVLVNVDLFGEGFDLPAIEVVILARPTMSRGLAWQQIGRVLRLLLDGPVPTTREARLRAIANSAKPYGIIIDHVGITLNPHLGLPDRPHAWTLDRRDRKARQTPDDVIPLRACANPECLQIYERVLPACPYCGHHPVPADRSSPEMVDGDLTELDADTLALLRGEVAKLDQPVDEYIQDLAAKRCPTIGIKANAKRHEARQAAQAELREWMAWYGGHNTAKGRSDAEGYRRFYHTFGVDVLSAQALGVAEAEALTLRIQQQLNASGG
jgi:DNA repair protein RadD